jgi:F-type H+-transporting ATPase subunit b
MEKLINDFSITLFAMQFVLFLILLFLLGKFAWKPIIKALDEREENILSSIEAAERTREEMKQLKAHNEMILREARAERDEIIRAAKETANRVMDEARAEAKALVEKELEKAREMIKNEKAVAMIELKQYVIESSLEIAEKIVRGDMSSDAKQKDIAAKFVDDINLN